MGPTRSADSLPQTREQRRLAAGQLFEQGSRSDVEIARLLGACTSTVRSWRLTWTTGGPEALLAIGTPGAQCALNETQRQDLRELLRRGAENYGFATDGWTLARIHQVIDERFSVAYNSLSGISRLLHAMGFTLQLSDRRATGCYGGTNRDWVDTTW